MRSPTSDAFERFCAWMLVRLMLPFLVAAFVAGVAIGSGVTAYFMWD